MPKDGRQLLIEQQKQEEEEEEERDGNKLSSCTRTLAL